MDNRIEEVKNIVADFGAEVKACVDSGNLKRLPRLTDSATKEICQLFPQPLTDKELRERLAEWLSLFKWNRALNVIYADEREWLYTQINQILALLPDIEEARRQERERVLGKDRPKIVCLCGSTRFKDAFTDAQLRETLNGHIVLTIGCNMKADTEIFGHLSQEEFNETKIKLDELHKRKIDLADEVMILNVGGYIGDSTRAELGYAKSKGKPIRYLEALKGGE